MWDTARLARWQWVIPQFAAFASKVFGSRRTRVGLIEEGKATGGGEPGMDAGLIVAIVVGVIVLVALVALLGKRKREERLETRRGEAREHREQAQVRSARADRAEAEAEERA